MSPAISVAADILVAILLVATIATSLRLSRQMVRLKADESAMRATVADLVAATDAAERAITGLRSTVSDSERALTDRLSAAMRHSTRLAEQVAAGEAVITRVGQIAEASRRIDAPALPPVSSAERAARAEPQPGGSLREAARVAREVAARAARRLDERAA